jgi:hypothetical protein
MAREIVAWCDVCLSEDRNSRGRTVSITLDGAIPVGLDLCDEHEDEQLGTLRALMSKYGAPVQPVRKSASLQAPPREVKPEPPAVVCPICRETRSTLQSMGQHLNRSHDISLPERAAAPAFFGLRCPVCGEGPFANLGIQHAIGSHPELQGGGPALFARARQLGDPHGVVAQHEARVRNAIGKPLGVDGLGEAQAAS